MMKIINSLIFVLGIFLNVYAQPPQKLSYQAIIRNSLNALVTNQNISMRLSILQGSPDGSAVYIETQKAISNSNGLVSVVVGNGTVISGDFSKIIPPVINKVF